MSHPIRIPWQHKRICQCIATLFYQILQVVSDSIKFYGILSAFQDRRHFCDEDVPTPDDRLTPSSNLDLEYQKPAGRRPAWPAYGGPSYSNTEIGPRRGQMQIRRTTA